MPLLTSGRRNHPESEEQDRLLQDEEVNNGISTPHQFERLEHRGSNMVRCTALLPLRYAALSLHSLALKFRHLPPTIANLGFFGTIRVLLNYTEFEREKLRSTAWLDGLRGLAAFEVFVFHYIEDWLDRRAAWGEGADHLRPEWYYAPIIRTFYASGNAAVCLFFGISGYVLSYRMLILVRQRQREELLTSLSSACFRRGIRLYMPVIVETLILMIMCRYLGLPKPERGYESAPTLWMELRTWYISILHLLLPLRYPDRVSDLYNRYDGHISWTIPLEYYGSLYVYMAVLFLAQVQNIAIRRVLYAAMVAQSLAKDDWIAAQFVMGMGFADYQLQRQSEKQTDTYDTGGLWSRFRSVLLILLFILGFIVSGMPRARIEKMDDGTEVPKARPVFDWIAAPIYWSGLYQDREADRYILCLASMACLIGIGETPKLRRLLEIRPIQHLGRISFGLYLCHVFLRAWLDPLRVTILSIVGLDTNKTFEEWDNRGNLFVAYVMFMIPITIVNLIVAGLFERYLDKPSVSAGRKFEKWCLYWKEKTMEAPSL